MVQFLTLYRQTHLLKIISLTATPTMELEISEKFVMQDEIIVGDAFAASIQE